jgi:DNA-binding MarR family transcriptional regulator
MRAHSDPAAELEAEVLSPRGLTINDFEALMHLSRADEQRLRRVDLVELLMLTPSGVTRLLDGLRRRAGRERPLRVGRPRHAGRS